MKNFRTKNGIFTGDVGIGTTSPTDKLDIASDFENFGITVTNSSANPARLTLTNTEGSATIDCNNDLLRLGNNSTEDLVIDSDGNVGIGTTDPGYILHVLEDNSAVYNPTGASSTIYQQSIVNVNTSADTGAFLSLSSNSNQTGTSIIGSIGGSNAKDSQLVFLTRDGSATGDPIKEHMRIDSSGNVGIGTTSPDSALHVMQSGDVNDGITLQQVNYAKKLNLRTNSAGELIVDVDDGTVEAMRIKSDGNVGIGTTSPSAVFHVEKHSNLTQASPHFKIRGNVYNGLHWLNGTAYYIGQDSTVRSIRIFSGDSTTGVELMHGATAWSAFSDERLKENITNLDSVIDKIKDIRCVSYTRSDVENSKETIGFIAQDFIGKFDQVINKSKISDEDKEEYYSIKYTETIPVLMKAIQEQQQTIDDLKSQNESLAARISALES